MAHHQRNTEELFLHKSGLSAYKRCPLRFKYMYVDPIWADRDEEMVYGTEFHDAVRRFYYLMDVDVLFAHDTFQDRLQYLMSCRPDGYRPRVNKWLYNYCKMEAKRSLGWTNPKNWFMPLNQERYYELRSPQKYAGTIDRVDHYDKWHLIVIDYKTGKFHDWLLSELRQEMALYAVILNNHPQSPVQKTGKYVAYWATIHPSIEYVYLEEFKPQTLSALAKNTVKIWNSVKKGSFPAKVGEHCDWCPFLYRCCTEDWYIEEAL